MRPRKVVGIRQITARRTPISMVEMTAKSVSKTLVCAENVIRELDATAYLALQHGQLTKRGILCFKSGSWT